MWGRTDRSYGEDTRRPPPCALADSDGQHASQGEHMTSPAPTMTRTDEVTTTEPEVAHDWLQAVYPGYRPEDSNSHRGFRFRAAHTAVGFGSVAQLRYSTSADNNVELDS